MSRVVVIGGSGHVGTYLVPRLVSAGFEVVSVAAASARRINRGALLLEGADALVRHLNL